MENITWGSIQPTVQQTDLMPWFKIQNGENLIRVLSNPIVNKHTHYIAANKTYLQCTRPDCLICQEEKRTSAKNSARPEYKCYILDRTDDSIKVYTFGTQVLNAFAKIFQDKDQMELGNFDAYDLKLTKGKSANGQVEYSVVAPNLPKFLKPLSKTLLDEITVLPSLLPNTSKSKVIDIEDEGLNEKNSTIDDDFDQI
jgi:hypothetical protein